MWRARRVGLANLDMQRVTCGQNGLVGADMTLSRAPVANAAVTMLDVVPVHKVTGQRLRRGC